MKKKDIPNFLTALRGLLTVIMAVLFFMDFTGRFYWIYGIYLLAVLSDFLDGYLARKWNVTSTVGAMFDPLLDKVLTLTLYMLLIPYNIIHAGIFVVLLLRELLVDGMKNFMMSKGEATPAVFIAKVKTATQMIMLNFLLLFLMFPQTPWLQQTAWAFGVITTLAAVYSGFIYTRKFLNFIGKNND